MKAITREEFKRWQALPALGRSEACQMLIMPLPGERNYRPTPPPPIRSRAGATIRAPQRQDFPSHD